MSEGDHGRALKFVQNLNVGYFVSTMVPNFFKLCRIINFYEDYKCIVSVICDLYSRSHWLKI